MVYLMTEAQKEILKRKSFIKKDLITKLLQFVKEQEKEKEKNV